MVLFLGYGLDKQEVLMNNVEVIKAVKSDRIVRGKTLDILKVAAYCRVSTDFAD